MIEQMTRSMSLFSAMTLISRVFGYVRDAVIFIGFGAGITTDAFLVAFRLPNLLRRLFAEGAFLQAFVPVLSEYKEHRPDEVQGLINRCAGTLGLVLLIISVIGVVTAPLFVLLFAPGFYGAEGQALAGDMLRIVFPYILFVSLTALIAGVLNVYHHYAIPALTPAILNISIIIGAVWFAPLMDEPIKALAWAVFVAGVLQLLVQIGMLRKIGYGFRFIVAWSDPGVKRVMRLMLPGIFGASVVQFNLLIDTMIASFLISGSISWLYISDRFVELPNGLFGVGIATVLLAHLSANYAAKKHEAFQAALCWAGNLICLLAIPCMIGLILFSEIILVSLVQYREFSALDTQMAQMSLVAYALGLPAFMLVKVLSASFFSRQNMRLPVKVAMYALVMNLVLNLSFVGLWTQMQWQGAHVGLALATSCASWFNASCLYYFLKRDGYNMTLMRGLFYKVILASAGMGLLVWLLCAELGSFVPFAVEERMGLLGGLVFVGVLVYFILLFILGLRPREFLRPQKSARQT